jgi:hypothetical protein
MTDDAPRPVPPLMVATWEAATTDPDPLAALGATRALTALLSTWESRLVGEAVAAGATWETIGTTVGVSRQAAWQRFHDEAHEFRRRARTELHELRNRHRDEVLELRDRLKSEARSRRRPRDHRRDDDV